MTEEPQLRGADYKVEIPSGLPFKEWLYKWLLDPEIEGNHLETVDKWVCLYYFAHAPELNGADQRNSENSDAGFGRRKKTLCAGFLRGVFKKSLDKEGVGAYKN